MTLKNNINEGCYTMVTGYSCQWIWNTILRKTINRTTNFKDTIATKTKTTQNSRNVQTVYLRRCNSTRQNDSGGTNVADYHGHTSTNGKATQMTNLNPNSTVLTISFVGFVVSYLWWVLVGKTDFLVYSSLELWFLCGIFIFRFRQPNRKNYQSVLWRLTNCE